MENTNIVAPLAQALADKGYTSLTSVQRDVLAQDAGGRDLLVSAQTGSGKTVAFGLAIATEVLDDKNRLLYAAAPLALIVAPTRELALQVKREFEWLYAVAGARMASCVGGMDYRGERRALEQGAHIVVGTPGRLRDHIERGSLDLSACRAVVLDEADEMLDLGFAEDLEFILSASPETRRTLLFSATVPKEIEKIAKKFQKNALRIMAKGEARQHDDIEYRALSVASRDKEPAIFNMLRFYEAQTAIVFAKTRANVNHLFARMLNRGFKVVALSGELSQAERMHALQSLRDGRARVCVATDVAARGIDLPGLELVIHADLPANSDILLHRSGRTGRAGNKGVSALIVPPAEFRKAGRLLHGAKVTAEWGTAPSADDVQRREDERLLSAPLFDAPVEDEVAMVEAILAQHGAPEIAAAFLRQWRIGRSAPEVLSETVSPNAAPPPPRSKDEFGDAVWFTLSVGHTGRAEARWLLPKVCDAGGISKDGIGAIRIREDITYIQISTALADRFGNQTEIDDGLVMTRSAGPPEQDGGARGPARGAPAARKGGYKDSKPSYAKKDTRKSGDFAQPRAAGGDKGGKRFDARPSASEGRAPPKYGRARDDASAGPREDAGPSRPRPSAAPYDKPKFAGKPGAKPYGKPGGPYKAGAPAGDRPAHAGAGRPAAGGYKGKAGAPGDARGGADGATGYSKKPTGGKPSFGAGAGGGKPGGAGKGAYGKPARAAAGPGGGKPSFGKPAKPRGDARDTSKRFVAPKKA